MKTLHDILVSIEKTGHDVRKGRLVFHVSQEDYAMQALRLGLKFELSPNVPPGEVNFFPDIVARKVILPEDKEFKAWQATRR